ncbi:MAG: hypothetical protein KDA51_01345 [Planctomycetales bacterium]|nr:hypothetical protein [Planctomycetales bacterium]
MGDVFDFSATGKKERFVWIATQSPVLDHNMARLSAARADQTQNVLHSLLRDATGKKVAGVVFGVIKSDGRMELGFTDICFDNPVIAQGIASQLNALVQGWPDHPTEYLPVLDE